MRSVYNLRKRSRDIVPEEEKCKSNKKHRATIKTNHRVNPLKDLQIDLKKSVYEVPDPSVYSWVPERIENLMLKGIMLNEISPQFHSYVFDGYLKYRSPRESLVETVNNARLCVLVQSYLPRCAWKRSVLKYFEDIGVTENDLCDNWPKTAMEKIAYFLNRKYTMLQALNNTFYLIFDFLERDAVGLSSLWGLFPEEEFTVSVLYKSLDICEAIDLYITDVSKSKMREAGMNNTNIRNFFVNFNGAVSTIKNRARQYPRHLLVGRDAGIKLIVQLSQTTSHDRRELLAEALDSYGFHIRSDSKLAQSFINGKSGYKIEEVVGLLRITRKLFSYSHREWSNYHLEWEKQFRRDVFVNGLDWVSSCEKVMRRHVTRVDNSFRLNRFDFYSDNGYDYGELEDTEESEVESNEDSDEGSDFEW